MWDFRTPKECMLFKDVEEYISCMIVSEGKRNLVCSSGEGTITAYNFRGKRLEVQVNSLFRLACDFNHF